MHRHEARTILILGAARGIGAACAERLSEEGATVLVADIDLPAAEERAARIVASGGAARALAYDQGDVRSVVDVVGRAGELQGGLDGLVSNAAAVDLGRSGADRPIDAIDETVWERSFSANVTHHAVATREVLPLMLRRGGGSIVYISSDWSVMGGPFMPAYAASKAALVPLARQVCLGHGKRGVRANVVSPGLIATEATLAFVRDHPEDHGIDGVGDIHSPQLGTAQDVAALVAFLLSDEAGYINGQTISINGGAYCRF